MTPEEIAKQVIDQWGGVSGRSAQINVDQLLCLAKAIAKDSPSSKPKKTKPKGIDSETIQ